MSTFQHDGITFHYLDHEASSAQGRQVPFVFQHGIGGTLRQPISLMTPRPASVRLISMDSRGHGETQPKTEIHDLRFATFADDVIALMDYLELPRAVVGGISMGAGVALNMALRFPRRVAGLILSRPAWLAGPMAAMDLYQRIAACLRRAGAVEGRELFMATPEYREVAIASPDAAKSLLGQFDEARALTDVIRLDALPADRPFELLTDLFSIRTPTLVLATGQDPVHPLVYGHTLAQCIPEARFVEVTSKSQSLERHQREMREAINSFLAELMVPAEVPAFLR